MANLVVVYDAAKEMAAIVDTDARMGWGPAMVGPYAGEMLEGFITSIPFDVGLLDAHQANRAFQEWLDGLGATAMETAVTAPVGTLEPSGDSGGDEPPIPPEWGLGGSQDAPEPQSADTDPDAGPGTAHTLVLCPLCGGVGSTSDGEDGATRTCAMCKGAKVVPLGVPS